MRKLACVAIALELATAGIAVAAADPFKDPLDLPAAMVKRQLTTTQMSAVTHAGERLVAVGIRGLVLLSDNNGKTWQQAPVPVSSDLLDVHFPTSKDGWVVGQDGVVLHSKDGGNTWQKQFDGRLANKLLSEHFQAQVTAGNATAQRYLQDTQLNYTNGPEQALLGVWFSDAQHGFVCGSFGTVLATNDGGATWESWVENVEVDVPPHYYAIRGTKAGVLMASEKGTIFRLDAEKKRFIAMPTGYTGTFFNLIEAGDSVFAVGLRGTAYRLKNGTGAKWEKVDTGVTSTIAAGAVMTDGQILLVTVTGQMASSKDGGAHFQMMPVAHPMSFAGIAAAGPGSAIVVGSGGISTLPLH